MANTAARPFPLFLTPAPPPTCRTRRTHIDQTLGNRLLAGLRSHERLNALLLRYLHVLLVQTARSVACCRFHSLVACACYLQDKQTYEHAMGVPPTRRRY